MDKKATRAAAGVVVAFAVAALVARFIVHDEKATSSSLASKYAAPEETGSIRALSSGADVALAVGDDGLILRRAAGRWQRDVSPTHATLRGVAQRADEAVAVGDGGTILEYGPSGWKLATSPTTAALRAVVYTAYGAIAVGDGGAIVQRLLPGEPWRIDPSGTTSDLRGACAGLRDVWAVGTSVILSRSLVGWRAYDPAPHVTLNAAACDDHAAIAVGEKGAMLERLDDVGWHDSPSPTKEDLLAVSASVGTRSWLVVGAHGVTVRAGQVEPSGGGWDVRAVTEGPLGTFLGGEGGLLRRD